MFFDYQVIIGKATLILKKEFINNLSKSSSRYPDFLAPGFTAKVSDEKNIAADCRYISSSMRLGV